MNRISTAMLLGAFAAAPASAQLTWFNNQADFEAAAAGGGNALVGVEDYEASIMAPNSVDGFDDSLQFGVPNIPDGFPYPNGTQGLAALTTQSNLNGAAGFETNPRGLGGLAAGSDGFLGIVGDVVIANTFVDSLDLIFDGALNSAVGGRMVDLLGAGNIEIMVFDTNNNLIGQMNVPGDAGGSSFAGVISTVPIGRLNLFSSGAEGMDDIQLWVVPAPASLSLLALGGMVALRRRR